MIISCFLQGKPKVPSNGENFIGRKGEIEEIVDHLKSGSTRIVSVYGPPGSGKSEVSKAVGQTLNSQENDAYYVDLTDIDTEENLISAIRRFFLDPSPEQLNWTFDFLLNQLSKIEKSVAQYFILDNADCLLQSELRDRFICLIQEILTNCETLTVLVTTRERLEFSKLKSLGIKLVRVALLDHESSETLVRKWLSDENSKPSDEDCRKIARFCEDMPFAIRLFCNNMPRKKRLPMKQAIDNFIRLIEGDLSRMDDRDESKYDRLNFVLESSYQALSRQDQEHYVSLSVIPGIFSVDVAAAVWEISVDDAESILKSFQRKSYIDSYSETGSFKVHKILCLFAKQKGEQQMKDVLLRSKTRWLQFYISLFAKLSERFVSGQSMSAFTDFHQDKDNIISSLTGGCSDKSTCDSVFEALIQGMLFLDAVLWSDRVLFDKIYDAALIEAAKHDNMTTYHHLLLAKGFSEVTWRSEEGKTMPLLSSQANEVLACSSDEQKGKLLCFLGIHKLSNGQLKDGVEYLKESLAHLMDTTDPTLRILKIIAFQIIATYYESTINKIEETNFFEKAVDECRALKNCFLFLSPNEKRIADQQDLPLVLEVHFLITKATKLFSSAERMKSFEENVLQMKENSDTNLLSNTKEGSFYLHRFIAGVLAEMTRYEEAIKLIQNLIDARERVLVNDVNPVGQAESSNDDHKKALARSYSYLAVLQLRIKDYKASVKSERRALDYTIDLCGEEHSDTADSYHELGNIMRSLGDCNSALLFHQRALDIRLILVEKKPLKEAASHHELGVTQWELKDYSSALKSHEKALQIRSQNLGDKHRDTAKSFHELGITQWFLEKYECALDSHEKALTIIQDEIGENPSATADSLHEIGKTYFCLGDYQTALQSHLDAFRIRLDVLGERHTDTANSCYEIGVTQFEMGWYPSALEYLTRALKMRQVLYTDTLHAEIAQSFYQLGCTQYQMGNFDQAVESLSFALSVRRDLQQEQHIETADVFYELGRAYYRKKDYSSAFVMHQFAIGILTLKMGEANTTVGDSLFQLCLVQSKRWRFKLSLQLLKRAQDIWMKSVNTEHDEIDSYITTDTALMEFDEFSSTFSSIMNAFQITTRMMAKEDKALLDVPYERQLKYLLSQNYKSSLKLYDYVSTIIHKYSPSVEKHKNLVSEPLSNLKTQLLKKATSYYHIGNKEFDADQFVTALNLHQRALNLRKKLLSEGNKDLASSYNSVGNVQYRMIDYTSALKSYQQALKIHRKTLGENHPDTATSYHNIGCSQHALGDYTSALKLHKRALKIRRKTFGENHPDTAASYDSTGEAQQALGDYTSALQSFQRALEICRKTLGENHPRTATSYDSTGQTQQALGDYTSAIQSHQRGLEIRRKTLGENHPRTATSYDSTGQTQQALGDYTSAIQSHQRALEIHRKTLGENHPDTAASYDSIGIAQQALGDYASALHSHQRALEIHRKTLGENHPNTAVSHHDIGHVQNALRDNTSALQSQQRALEIRRKTLGENHPHTAASYDSIGNAQQALGDYTSALQSHQRGLEIQRKTLGENHPNTAFSYNNIGNTQQALGDYTSALQSHQQALEIRRKTLGENHPDTAASYNNIGIAQEPLGDYTSALQSHQRALEIHRKTFGGNHPHTAGSYYNIGNIQEELGDYTSALQSHQRALEIRGKILGENHPDTAASYNNTGIAQEQLGDYTSALQSHQRALEIHRKTFGGNHPHTAGSYYNIGNIQEELGDYTSALQSHQRALEIRRETFGENHPNTAVSYYNTGNVQEALGDHTSALHSHQRALEIRRKTLGENHHDTAVS